MRMRLGDGNAGAEAFGRITLTGFDTRQRAADAALLLAVVLLGLFGLYRGFDASELVSGDALYPVQLLDFPLLEFRPPPPNRVFPDVAVHWLLSFVITDPLLQKIAAGLILFAATMAVIGLFKGQSVFTLVTLVTISLGFEFTDSACHYTLPLLVLLYQLSMRHRVVEHVTLFAVVFSNILVLLPLAVLALDPAARDRIPARLTTAGLALLASALYADFGVAVVQLAAVLPVWGLTLYLSQRLGVYWILMILICVGLLVGAALGLAPTRYALPVLGGLIVAVTPLRAPQFSWRYVAWPAAISAIFLATMDTSRARQRTAEFDCLAAALAERGIANIAADHWTAKPLYFAARERGLPLTITQTDFAEGDTHSWMAPYAFFGAPTPWAVRNTHSCILRQGDPTYCGQATLATPLSREPVCNNFDLLRYDVTVPLRFEGRPANKLAAIRRQLSAYISKAHGLVSKLAF